MNKHRKLILFAILVFAQIICFCQTHKLATINTIVNEMAANNLYERSAKIGYAGTHSKQLELYEQLKATASENELIDVAMNHKSAVVRLYAFDALKQKTKIIPKSLIEKFGSDSTEVMTLTGCIGEKRRVKSLAFTSVNQQQLAEEMDERLSLFLLPYDIEHKDGPFQTFVSLCLCG